MSAAPSPAVSEIMGRELPFPLAPVNWRTRRETTFIRTLGFTTFSRAFLQYSLFKIIPYVCKEWSPYLSMFLIAIHCFKK